MGRKVGSRNRSTLAREQAEREKAAQIGEELANGTREPKLPQYSRSQNVKNVIEKHNPKKGLYCDGCGEEIFRSTLNTTSIQLLYDAWDDSSEFKLVCKTCSAGADSTVPLVRLFPNDFLKSVARLTAYCSKDAVSLLQLYRLFESVCARLKLESDVNLGTDMKYKTWNAATGRHNGNTQRLYMADEDLEFGFD